MTALRRNEGQRLLTNSVSMLVLTTPEKRNHMLVIAVTEASIDLAEEAQE